MSLSTIIESYDVNVCLVTQAIVHYIIHSLFLFLNMLPKCFIQKCTLIYRTKKPLPMQIDGEPWMQPPCTVSVHHFQNTNFLHKSHSNDSIFWICSLKRFIQIHRLICSVTVFADHIVSGEKWVSFCVLWVSHLIHSLIWFMTKTSFIKMCV